MPILFSVVSRSVTVLAKYASCVGNFTEVTEQILAKISPENTKLTYSQGDYLFHYVTDARIVYLCITDKEFDRATAFAFLTEIKKKFQLQYGARAQTALPYAMNSEFSMVLASQMKHFSESPRGGGGGGTDYLSKAKEDIDEMKGIMVKNIDQIADRGEKLELLVDKTDDLQHHAVSFRTSSRTLARSMWWKNVKIMLILAFVALLLIYVIIGFTCGFFFQCFHKNKTNN